MKHPARLSAVRRRVRRRELSPMRALELLHQQPDVSPKLLAWLRGRVAWDMGRRRVWPKRGAVQV